MNEQLINFIELCLVDGVITEKEREVIFRKSKDLGIPTDECEIILNGMITKHGYNSITKNDEIKIEENYVEESNFKVWFIDWLKTEKQIINLKSNLSSHIKKFFINEIDGTEKKGSLTGDYIKEETLLKMCELEHIPDIPDSFWKKGIKGKEGSIENKYKDIIKSTLQEEKFICYLSSCKTKGLGFDNFLHWTNSDLVQMIEHYTDPTKKLEEEGWYYFKTNPHLFMLDVECVLITNKSIIEFNEKLLKEPTKLNLDELSIETFLDQFGYFKMVYQPIEGLFKSKPLNITSFIPKPITHDNKRFVSKLKQKGINDYTKRLINVDEKIKEFLDSKYNSQLIKLLGKEFHFFGFGVKKDVIGREKIVLKESSITETLHKLSLELFNVYLRFLNLRDSLLNLYLNKQEIELEGILIKFENSELGMSKFQQDTLSTLKEINENLLELKEITQVGMSDISEQLGLVMEELDTLNESNEKIIKSIDFNNFISLVNLYQNYKINENTKSLRE